MKDTRFFLPEAERNRLAAVYASGSDRKIAGLPKARRGKARMSKVRVEAFPGAGLTSTARDYARFLETIRNGGALGGVRVLAPRTAELMTTNQSGTLHSSHGLGFGYGFETVDRLWREWTRRGRRIRLGRRLWHDVSGRPAEPHRHCADASVDARRHRRSDEVHDVCVPGASELNGCCLTFAQTNSQHRTMVSGSRTYWNLVWSLRRS